MVPERRWLSGLRAWAALYAWCALAWPSVLLHASGSVMPAASPAAMASLAMQLLHACLKLSPICLLRPGNVPQAAACIPGWLAVGGVLEAGRACMQCSCGSCTSGP